MTPDAYLTHLQNDGDRLIAAAKTAPEANVPSCPDWDLTALVQHIGGAHRWVESMVRARATEMLPFPERRKARDESVTWYEEGLSSLIDALATAGPDAQVWNWVANGPGPSTFWHRRMAQETSIHRWDAENAVGQAGPIDTELALDGIDEALDMLAMRLSMQSEPELSGKLALAATDAAWACTLQLAPDAVRRGEGADGADSVVRGTASDLHLWLTGRRGEGSTIVVEGDHAAADALGRMKFG